MSNRTGIDFSNHKLKITKLENCLIHEFKIPSTNDNMLVFINTCGVMTVTGDYGNWVFCREFHPSSENNHDICDGYWDEKLEISSVQKPYKYDCEETIKCILDFKSNFEDNYGRQMTQDEKDWLDLIEENVFDEYQYIYFAYRHNPTSINYESIPFGTKRHIWLDIVYDGFDEICKVMKRDKTLRLTLSKKWFDLIEKGIKKEEYREIKGYWITRLKTMSITGSESFKEYDFVEFTNGYSKTSPQITMEFKDISIDIGKSEWGAVENTKYFVIKLGDEISRKNC